MASVKGSQLAFFGTGVGQSSLNNVVTTDGTKLSGPTVSGSFNIEVFTTASAVTTVLGAGFDASAFIQGAVKVPGTNNEIVAGSLGSTEQLLAGNYFVVDRTGGETIQLAGSGVLSVASSAGDTITGSTVSSSRQVLDLEGDNPITKLGPMTAIGGAGNTTVWAATGDSIAGGSGPMFAAGNGASNMKITGGAGNLTTFNFGTGNSVTGSTTGFTFVGDGYGGSGNTIGGGGGNGPGTDPAGGSFTQGTEIIAGNKDVINGGSGTMLVNALGASGLTVTGGSGAATVWGGTGGADTGGPGALQFNDGVQTKVTGGAGALNAFQLGAGNTITGGSSTNVINDAYGAGLNSLLIAGAGSSTIFGGSGDTIQGGTGALEARILQGFGPQTVNLGSGVSGVRDVSVVGSAVTKATVTGFNTASDVIESATSVVAGALTLPASSTVTGGNTVISFTDGNIMTIVGVTTGIKFTT
jgi:hypothetical protein